jgi:hypothetical protein
MIVLFPVVDVPVFSDCGVRVHPALMTAKMTMIVNTISHFLPMIDPFRFNKFAQLRFSRLLLR